jgi:hypothetical protein
MVGGGDAGVDSARVGRALVDNAVDAVGVGDAPDGSPVVAGGGAKDGASEMGGAKVDASSRWEARTEVEVVSVDEITGDGGSGVDNVLVCAEVPVGEVSAAAAAVVAAALRRRRRRAVVDRDDTVTAVGGTVDDRALA